MSKFTVEVIYTCKKNLNISADTEDEAIDTATRIVERWQDVMDVEEANVIDGDGES